MSKIKQYVPWLAMMVIGVIAGACSYGLNPPPAQRAVDFTLNSVDGPVSLAGSDGRLRIVYVGYMSCPDICPTSLSRLGGALYLLSDSELTEVEPLFVSVDVKRDTVENLALYSHYFHPAITGATGSQSAVDQVVDHLQAYYRIVPLDESGFGYAIDHSANIYLLDDHGQLLDTWPDTLPSTEIAERLREYLSANNV